MQLSRFYTSKKDLDLHLTVSPIIFSLSPHPPNFPSAPTRSLPLRLQREFNKNESCDMSNEACQKIAMHFEKKTKKEQVKAAGAMKLRSGTRARGRHTNSPPIGCSFKSRLSGKIKAHLRIPGTRNLAGQFFSLFFRHFFFSFSLFNGKSWQIPYGYWKKGNVNFSDECRSELQSFVSRLVHFAKVDSHLFLLMFICSR